MGSIQFGLEPEDMKFPSLNLLKILVRLIKEEQTIPHEVINLADRAILTAEERINCMKERGIKEKDLRNTRLQILKEISELDLG